MSMRERPLSPHLQIYSWRWTMALSILHRASGVALGVGTLLLVWWLVALAAGPQAFADVQVFIGSWFGRLCLFGWTWALLYHLCNGIRHLVWDMGLGFELTTARNSGYAVAAASVVLTVAVWVAGYVVMA